MPNINDFSSQFRGGVRPNLFMCYMYPPTGSGMTEFSYLCKGTSMPVSQIGNIDVPYNGRQLKVPGDRTFADWTVTVFNDPEMHVRGVFEGWMRDIQAHDENYQDSYSHEVYGSANIFQMDRTGNILRTYNMTSIYPTECAAIDLAWDSNDQVEEYSVTFAVNHWETDIGDGSGIGGAAGSLFGGVRVNRSGNVRFNVRGAMQTALGGLTGGILG